MLRFIVQPSTLARARSCVGGLRIAAASLTMKSDLEPPSLTMLEHNMQLSVVDSISSEYLDAPSSFCWKKLICTIGPASEGESQIQQLMRAGMSVARLNFSHGSRSVHIERLKKLRSVASREGIPEFAIALDTKGAEIRTGSFDASAFEKPSTGVNLVSFAAGDKVRLTADPKFAASSTKDTLFISYPNLAEHCDIGKPVLISDGSLQLTITGIDKENNAVETVVFCGASITGRNNVHLLGPRISVPPMSETDVEDISVGVRNGIDMVFASFMQCAQDVVQVRKVLSSLGVPRLPIIAKIESQKALQNIDEIIKESDGIMIARGDLGMDLPIAKLFLAQKKVAALCSYAAKPVICATQMLETMIWNPRPTRAEASDVANAVIDGVDCLMLSGETAKGAHPIDATRTLRSIAVEAERYVRRSRGFHERVQMMSTEPIRPVECAAAAAVLTSFKLDAVAIFTTTISVESVRLLVKYSPRCPVIAVCRSIAAARMISIIAGVVPVYYDECSGISLNAWSLAFESLVARAIADAKGGALKRFGLDADTFSKGIVVLSCTDSQPDAPMVKSFMQIRSLA